VIGMLTELDRSVCVHCGEDVTLWQSDLEREPFWSHTDSGQRPCHDAPLAEPMPADPGASS
jgi:hypothetical protein